MKLQIHLVLGHDLHQRLERRMVFRRSDCVVALARTRLSSGHGREVLYDVLERNVMVDLADQPVSRMDLS